MLLSRYDPTEDPSGAVPIALAKSGRTTELSAVLATHPAPRARVLCETLACWMLGHRPIDGNAQAATLGVICQHATARDIMTAWMEVAMDVWPKKEHGSTGRSLMEMFFTELFAHLPPDAQAFAALTHPQLHHIPCIQAAVLRTAVDPTQPRPRPGALKM